MKYLIFSISLLISANLMANQEYSIRCDRMGGIFPAEVEGKVWFSGGGARISGLLTIKITDSSGATSEFKDIEIMGSLDDEMDYIFILGSNVVRGDVIDLVQFNDAQPSASVVVFSDYSRYATNCLSGITRP